MKNYIPLSIRLNEAKIKLKKIGYTLIENDENFIILAEKIKIVCKNQKELFAKVDEILKNNINIYEN